MPTERDLNIRVPAPLADWLGLVSDRTGITRGAIAKSLLAAAQASPPPWIHAALEPEQIEN